jgi:hypothetical protein
MVDNSDYIPADAILFDKAFEILFDAIDPNAAELRAEINRLLETETSGPEYDDAVDKFDVARWDVDIFFRNELRYGALEARQRDPYTGKEMGVSAKDWEDPAILIGDDLAFPPIYFLKADFDAWLKKVLGENKERGRPPKERKFAERACNALWGGRPPKDIGTTEARKRVTQWCFDNMPHKETIVPGDDTIDRATGRKKG